MDIYQYDKQADDIDDFNREEAMKKKAEINYKSYKKCFQAKYKQDN